MKKPILSLPPWIQNLPEGTISGLLGTLMVVVLFCALAIPAVSADEVLTASFTFTPSSPTTADAVSFSGTSTWSNITSWTWDFGDGKSSNGKDTTHTFTDAKTYTVGLTVSDGNNNTESTTKQVTVSEPVAVNPPVASFSGTPRSGMAPLTVTFTDESKGEPTSWEWNFGDGSTSSAEKNPPHEYTSAGNYTVTLTVKNDGGSNKTAQENYIKVTAPVTKKPPVATFIANSTTGDAPLTVKFADTSQPFNGASITKWKWDFDDGSGTVTEQHPEHTFKSVKSYTVRLTVTDSAGLSSVPIQQEITVESSLKAGFSFDPSNPEADKKVTFTDESKGDPDGWTWDFGDKTVSSDAQHPSHKYAKDGIYTVKLTVKKSGASDNSITKKITVGDASLTPTASFTWEPSTPVVGSPVSFKDTSTGGGITEWKWDFDDKMNFTDNRKSILQNPQHTYENPGVYQVELFVRNSVGTGDIIVKQVTVRSVPLNARFSASPTSGTVPLSVRFVDSSTGTDIKSYEWDFGNGQTYSGKSPSNPVVYSSPGTYRPSLKIVDESGGYNEYAMNIIVNPPATATIAPLAAAPISTPASDGGGDGFISGEYRKMTGLYNEYIRLIFGFLGIANGPDFLLFAVEKIN